MENEVDAMGMVKGDRGHVVVAVRGGHYCPEIAVYSRERNSRELVELSFSRDSAIALAHYLLTITQA